MKTIQLDKGMCALVDDADLEFLSQFHWFAWKCGNYYYASTTTWVNGKAKGQLMHRLLCNNPTCMVDHKNGQTLDNRRSNLRPCSGSSNIANSVVRKSNTSGFKGVSRAGKKWRAYVGGKKGGTYKFLGMFDNPTDAAKAYDSAAISTYGEFAKTNRMLGLL